MNVQEFRQKFPQYDNMGDLDLAKSLHSKYYSNMDFKEFSDKFLGKREEISKKGLLSGFQRITDIYMEEVEAGQKAMERMIDKPKGKIVLQGLLGALQYGFAPLTAIGKGAFREPLETTERALGIPEPIVKTTGEMAEMIPGFLPYGKLVRTAIKGIPSLTIGKEVEEVGPGIIKSLEKVTGKAPPAKPIKPPLKYPVEPTPELAAELTAEGKLTKSIIQEGIQQQVANATEEVLKVSPPQEAKRIGQKIIDLIFSDQMDWKELPSILEKYNITAQEFALRLKDTYSAAGRSLARLSVVGRRVQKLFADNPKAYSFFNDVAKTLPEPTAFDKTMNFLYGLESTRRAFLVTQWATAMRNTLSQTAMVNIGAIDESLQGAIRATVGGEGNILRQIGEGLDTVIALQSRMSKAGRGRLNEILMSENAHIARIKLLSAPVHEVNMGGKIANFLNTPNRLQEHFFRKISFESKLMQLLERTGLDYKKIDPNKIPAGMLEEAAEHGLTMTFAAMPKSRAGQRLVRAWAGNPLMTALLNPFPRFNFGNALPFITNFSPISFMKALNPRIVADLATGNPDEFARIASKAVIGTSMLGMAVYHRMKSDGTDKYYQIQIGNRYWDTRSYAPLITPYLLVAEAMIRPEKLNAGDWAQVAVGLNRIAGTGLVATDLIRSKKMETAAQVIGRLTGEYLGSFSVPAKTFQDIYGGLVPEAGTYRETRERLLTGPIMRNIPGLAQILPEAESPVTTKKIEPPLEVGPVKVPVSIFRQATGLSATTKNQLQKEVDRLAIDVSRVYPKTGVPEADRMLSKYMAPVLERVTPALLENSQYQKLTRPMQRLALAELFRQARKRSRVELAEKNPRLFMQIKYEGFKEDIQEILESRGVIKP